MIISKTPYRISLLGGGTDYPSWYKLNGGQVISFTINKYIYISIRDLPPFFKHKLRLVYSKIENVTNVDKLIHPTAKEILKLFKIKKGLEIHYDGDLPAHSGLGSSSAFTVGLLNALNEYFNIKMSKKELAEKAIYIEQEIVKDLVGSQDQINTSFGGFNHIKFFKSGNFKVNKLLINNQSIQKLENNFMLFFTGISRISSKITKTYIKKLSNNDNLYQINQVVDEGLSILKKGDFNQLGELLDFYWNQKKKLSKEISNSYIDKIYKKAINAGAIGGKITGAGGGGFMLFYVPKNKQNDVKNALNKLLYVPFKIEYNGSNIIFNDLKY